MEAEIACRRKRATATDLVWQVSLTIPRAIVWMHLIGAAEHAFRSCEPPNLNDVDVSKGLL